MDRRWTRFAKNGEIFPGSWTEYELLFLGLTMPKWAEIRSKRSNISEAHAPGWNQTSPKTNFQVYINF